MTPTPGVPLGHITPGYRRRPPGYRATVTIDEATARRLLDEERAALERSLRTVLGDLGDEETGLTDELTTYDQHPADLGTELHDMERDLGLRTDLRRRLEENAAARQRLERGEYGTCGRCGRPIDEERLRAVPSTRFCAADEAAAAQGR